MNALHRLFAGLAVVALCNLNAFATTPEQAAADYFAAFRNGDLNAVAASMHPDELAAFKATMLPVIEKGMAIKDPRADLMNLRQIAGEDGIDGLRAMTDEAFFARFMGWLFEQNPMLQTSMAGAEVTPIGHVREGDLAHVVYRMEVDVLGSRISQGTAISLKSFNDAWRLMLTGEVEGMGRLIEANLDMIAP